MCKVLVTYDGRNKTAKALINSLATTKGVEINRHCQKRNHKNGLDEAIEDLKMGRYETYKNFDEFKKATDKMLGYV